MTASVILFLYSNLNYYCYNEYIYCLGHPLNPRSTTALTLPAEGDIFALLKTQERCGKSKSNVFILQQPRDIKLNPQALIFIMC